MVSYRLNYLGLALESLLSNYLYKELISISLGSKSSVRLISLKSISL